MYVSNEIRIHDLSVWAGKIVHALERAAILITLHIVRDWTNFNIMLNVGTCRPCDFPVNILATCYQTS
jgi:hypothetical protein